MRPRMVREGKWPSFFGVTVALSVNRISARIEWGARRIAG